VLRSKAYASIAYGNLSVWSKRVTAMCKRLLRFEGTQIAPGDAAAIMARVTEGVVGAKVAA
jgi:hypothetical protein